MANRPYLVGGSYHWTNGDLSWLADNIKVAGCSSAYTPDTTNSGDEFLSVIPGGAIVCTSPNLASKTNVGGALNADSVTFTSVSGPTITQFVIYNDSGVAATSELLAVIDTATNLPVVPNGGNIGLTWAGAPNFVMAFYRRKLGERFWAWLAGQRGQVARWTPGGLWIPKPRVIT